MSQFAKFWHQTLYPATWFIETLFYGLPESDLKRLQRIQNLNAKMILRGSRYDSTIASLQELHWLPVKIRIQFKLVTLVFKFLNNQALGYLQTLLTVRKVRPGLRAANSKMLLNVPLMTQQTFLNKSFAVSGPTLWNQLPQQIRELDSSAGFKSAVKSHYFSRCF